MPLGAGYIDSWIQSYQETDTPCLLDTKKEEPTTTPWMLWLLVGLVIGSLSFEKKRERAS